jgi:glycine dehydrogenase subunit 2
MSEGLIFESSKKGRRGYRLPPLDVRERSLSEMLDAVYLRGESPRLPEVSELDVVRHFTALSHENYGVDGGFYPLGSCTMKYNPKVNEDIASLKGFADLHPLQSEGSVQGMLELLYGLLEGLCELCGMAWGTLAPFAGAQGEFTGMKLFRAYFDKRGERGRRTILVPDSAHGTNPASAHVSGFDVVELRSDGEGNLSLEDLQAHLDESLAGIMLTNPNTLGLFERNIERIAGLVHDAGGLLYYDGANFNAVMGETRPGDMGFDVVHLNLHKTFSTPHGGGGPGSGPVLVSERLKPFLPVPDVRKGEDGFHLVSDMPDSIGRLGTFYGNIGVIVRAYAYLLSMGSDGLSQASRYAVLNANYVRERLKRVFSLPFDRICKHEFVLSAEELKERHGVSALDVAKALIDRGIHPPTIYFPLIVKEALMIEPVETESKATLDNFIEAMEDIAALTASDPQGLKEHPKRAVIRRPDEVKAAREPVLRYRA